MTQYRRYRYADDQGARSGEHPWLQIDSISNVSSHRRIKGSTPKRLAAASAASG